MNNPFSPNSGQPSGQQSMPSYGQQYGQPCNMPSNGQPRESIVSKLFKNSPVVQQNNNPRQPMPPMQQSWKTAGDQDGTSIAEIKKMSTEQIRNDIRQEEINNMRMMKEKSEKNKIHHLVKDINRHLDDYAPSAQSISQNTEDSMYDSDEDNTEQINKYVEKNTYIPNIIKEPLLIIVLYVVLSQSFVQKALGNYIPHMGINESGNVSLIGKLIYGTILALLFMFFRKIIK